MSDVLALLCALSALGLLVLASAVAVDRPHRGELAAATGVAPIALQLAWPVLGVAAATGRWWSIAPAAAASAAGAIAWLAATRPGGRGTPPDGPRLRVVSANVFHWNHRAAETWQAIAAYEPDLVLLQEISETSGAWLPPEGWHAHTVRRRDPFGTAILSRHPLLEVTTVHAGELPQLRCRLEVHGVPVTAWTVHPQAPIHRPADRLWRRQLAELGALLAAEPGPVVVVGGDFNATPLHRPFRNLLRHTGLRDARPGTRRLHGTWPSGGYDSPRLLPRRIMTLDHVLVRGAHACAARILDAGCSDHHPVAVELVLPVPP